jgi:hypothetical protein
VKPCLESRIIAVLLAICGGGGNDAAAWLIVVCALIIWTAVAVLTVRAARDRRERRLLICLLVVSILVGPVIVLAFFSGIFGPDNELLRLVPVLLIPGGIGAGIALKTGAGHGARAFLISTWGAIFLSGGTAIFFLAAVGVGSGCIE